MCDSVVLNAWIDKLTEDEYSLCQYPFRNVDDPDASWIEFRDIYPFSPLTGAQFSVTPLGVLLPGTTKRSMHGRIAGYRVSVNVPACVIGHNRLVVNSVYQGARACMELLKFWLALNGCTDNGLDHIQFAHSRLYSVTPLYLFVHETEQFARDTLADYRTHTEALLNKADLSEKSRTPAFSIPPKPASAEEKYTYTSYVVDREYKISCYVKEDNQPNSFLLPLADPDLESDMQDYSRRTFRVEIRVHEKWLKDKFLDDPMAWKDQDAPYEVIFDLVRRKLRLDDELREKRMKVPTVETLKLSSDDKKLLIWHLSDQNVLDHNIFRDIRDVDQRMSRYYATRKRIYDATKICIYLTYSVQIKRLSHGLVKTLEFPGEFKPPGHLEPHIFSRLSTDPAIRRLAEITCDVLRGGADCVPPLPKQTAKMASNRQEYRSQFERGYALDSNVDDDSEF
jgi:hypothetical protein